MFNNFFSESNDLSKEVVIRDFPLDSGQKVMKGSS